MPYTATIKQVKKEFSLPDNASYLDVCFDILLDGKVIVESLRMAFAMDTPEETITETIKRYCVVFEEDTLRAAEVEKRSESEKAADEIINNLTGKSL